jgi:hypothetical protein
MDLNRDLFITEFIINYLQSAYPDSYSDREIIKKFIRYKELKEKEDDKKLTTSNEEELQHLNEYFYGNTDGTSSNNAGYNLVNTYKTTIRIIEDLISREDNAVKDVVSELTKIIDVDIKDDYAFKRYLNELIIPMIFKDKSPVNLKVELIQDVPKYKFKNDESAEKRLEDKAIEKRKEEERIAKEKKESQQTKREEIINQAKAAAAIAQPVNPDPSAQQATSANSNKIAEKDKIINLLKQEIQKLQRGDKQISPDSEIIKKLKLELEELKKKIGLKPENAFLSAQEGPGSITGQNIGPQQSRYINDINSEIYDVDADDEYGNGDFMNDDDDEIANPQQRQFSDYGMQNEFILVDDEYGLLKHHPSFPGYILFDENGKMKYDKDDLGNIDYDYYINRNIDDDFKDTKFDAPNQKFKSAVKKVIKDERTKKQSDQSKPQDQTQIPAQVGNQKFKSAVRKVIKDERTKKQDDANSSSSEDSDNDSEINSYYIKRNTDEPEFGGGKYITIDDFDLIYDKINDLPIIQKLNNNKKLIWLLLNTHDLSIIISKNKPLKIIKEYINNILTTIFKIIKFNIIYFYNYDILLTNYFTSDEIIYYIFINYLYKYYKYIPDDKIIKNKQVIIKLFTHVKFTKKNIITDSKYLLTFIYKYSKLNDNSTLIGYDSFKTYMYLHSFGFLNSKITLNDTDYEIENNNKVNLYNFTHLKRIFNVEVSDLQLKACIKTIEKSKIGNKNLNTKFIINHNILDHICLTSANIFKDDYIDLPIINYKKYLTTKQYEYLFDYDNKYNILYLSSFVFRYIENIPVNLYCELVYYYTLLDKKDKNLAMYIYHFICLMYKKINNTNIYEKLIAYNVKNPEEFIKPKINKINDKEFIKYLINYCYYCYKNKFYNSFYDIFIPFLSFYYKYDIDNKLQIMIQELLISNNQYKKIIHGGTENLENTKPEEQSENDDFFTKENIDAIKEEFKKIKETIDKSITKLNDNGDVDKLITKMYQYIQLKSNPYSPSNPSDFEEGFNKYLQETTDDNDLKKRQIELNYVINQIEETIKKKLNSSKYEITLSPVFENFLTYLATSPSNNFITSIDKIKEINKATPIKKYISEYKTAINSIISDYNNDVDKFLKILQRYKKQLDSLRNELRDREYNKRPRQHIETDITKSPEPELKALVGGGDRKAQIENLNKLKTDLNTKIKDIEENLNKYTHNKNLFSNTERKLISTNFIDKKGDNIFDKLLKSYDDDINNKNIPTQIVNDLFYKKVQANNLDPSQELEIIFTDKIVFIVVVYILRLIATYLTHYMINTDRATTLSSCLYFYIIWYLILFTATVFIINFDTFYLRIFVNYLNLHINTTGILTHVLLMISFIYIVYLLIININGYERKKTRLSDPEKVKLKYKLDLLTMIIFVFIVIMVFII